MHKDSDKDSLHRMYDRTSVTVDEAVLILLGWANGPVIRRHRSDNPMKCISEEDPRTTSLDYIFTYMGLTLELEYEKAKRSSLPDDVIATKLSSMETFPDEVRQAKAYLRAIRDELNEGDSSALRIDRELSDGTVRFITWSSFDKWANDRFGISLATPTPPPTQLIASREVQEVPRVGVTVARQGSSQKSPAMQKLRAQEQAILDAIADLELDPKCLQRNIGRQHGAKYLLRTKLKGHPLFPSQRVFDKAWDRMLGSDIAYAEEDVSSP